MSGKSPERIILVSNSTFEDMGLATEAQKLLEKSGLEIIRLEYDQRFSHPYLPDRFGTPFHLTLVDGDPLQSAPRLCREDYIKLCGDDLDFIKLNAKDYWKNNWPETIEFLDPENMSMQRFRGLAWRFESLIKAIRPDGLMISYDGNPPLALMMMGKGLKLGIPSFFYFSGFRPGTIHYELFGSLYDREYTRLEALYKNASPKIAPDVAEAALARARDTISISTYKNLPSDEEAEYLTAFRAKFQGRVLLLSEQPALASNVYVALNRLGVNSLSEIYRQIIDSLPSDIGLIFKSLRGSELFKLEGVRNILQLETFTESALLSQVNAVVDFNSNLGLAAAVSGLPVLTLGEPYYAGKGFTLDWDGQAHLASLLSRLFEERPDKETVGIFCGLLEVESILSKDLPPKTWEEFSRIDELTPRPEFRHPFWKPGRGLYIEYGKLLENYASWAYKNYAYHEIMVRLGRVPQESLSTTVRHDIKKITEQTRTDTVTYNKTRFEFTAKFLPEAGRVLYLCCSGDEGYGAYTLSQNTIGRCLALDSRPDITNWAESVYNDAEISFKSISAGFLADCDLAESFGTFDLIVALGYLEHLPDDKTFMDTIRRLMGDKAVFIGSLPHNLPQNPIGNIPFHMRHYDLQSAQEMLNLQRDEYLRFFYQDNTIISDDPQGSDLILLLTKDESKLKIIEDLLPFSLEPYPTKELFLPAAFFNSDHADQSNIVKSLPVILHGVLFQGEFTSLPVGCFHVEFIFEPTSSIAADMTDNRKINLLIADSQDDGPYYYYKRLSFKRLLNLSDSILKVDSPEASFSFKAFVRPSILHRLSRQPVTNPSYVFKGVKLTRVPENELQSCHAMVSRRIYLYEAGRQLKKLFRTFFKLGKLTIRLVQFNYPALKDAANNAVSSISCLLKNPQQIKTRLRWANKKGVSQTKLESDEFEQYMNTLEDINIELTNHCTYKCVFCNRELMTRPKGFMSLEDLSWVIQNITCRAGFTGHLQVPGWGESLLDRQIIEKIALMRKSFPKARIMTTTTLGLQFKAGYFQELVKAGLNLIQVSCRGLTRESYAAVHGVDRFDLVMKNLKTLSEELTPLTLKCEVLVRGRLDSSQAENETAFRPDNKAIAEKFKNRIHGYGFHYSEDVLLNSGNTYIFNKLRPSAEPCSIYKGRVAKSLVISWDLKVVPCCRVGNQEIILGNLHEKSLREIFYGQPWREFQNAHRTMALKTTYPFCWHCQRDASGWNNKD